MQIVLQSLILQNRLSRPWSHKAGLRTLVANNRGTIARRSQRLAESLEEALALSSDIEQALSQTVQRGHKQTHAPVELKKAK